jgi:L-ascorbate metabolism protein UlaG (beta-lactamase superfamily)
MDRSTWSSSRSTARSSTSHTATRPAHCPSRAIAAWILGARQAIPIHADGYEIDGLYQPVTNAAKRFAAAAAERDVPVRILDLGETIEISAAETHHSTGD